MPKELLFAADADKVQDLVFRSARQRQIVGGSRILAEFGKRISQMAEEEPFRGRAFIHRGGSFRIVFPETADIDAFAEKLKLFYHLLFDAHITTVKTKDNETDFKAANENLTRELERAKAARRHLTDDAYAPIIAYCHDSRNGLAENYAELQYTDEGEYYLSKFACDMWNMGGYRYDTTDTFLRSILDVIDEIKPADDDREKLEQIAKLKRRVAELKSKPWAQNVDDIGELDPSHRNVAYLLVDVNNTGRLFRECGSEKELSKLSETLEKTLKLALAKQIPDLFDKLKTSEWLPLLPLIFAGDDVFVLLPAFYALDLARRFCKDFVESMQNALQNEPDFAGLRRKINNGEIDPPSISAAIIFCKSNYPYHLAHERGEKLLRETKRFSKRFREKREAVAALAFDYVIGNQLVKSHKDPQSEVLPTMNPFWIVPSQKPEYTEKSVNLKTLIDSRYALREMPNGQREKARALFNEFHWEAKESGDSMKEMLFENWTTRVEAWLARMKTLYQRVDKSGPVWLDELETALDHLGSPPPMTETSAPLYWRRIRRYSDSNLHHAFPDLLEIWDYAQDLEKPLSEYQEIEQ